MLSNLPQFVSASQPLTSLAYVFDGLHYGVSDFAYAARAMVSCSKEIQNCSVMQMIVLCVSFILSIWHFFCLIIDGRGCNIIRISAICSFCYGSFWGLVGFDSLHGLACCGWICQVTFNTIKFLAVILFYPHPTFKKVSRLWLSWE